MSQPRNVAVLVGSLRQESVNRKVARAVTALAPAHLAFDFPEIGDLPLFNEDLEAAPPAAWLAFREAIRRADAVLFATAEYNRSVPAVLKNAIDVGSRPYGESVWDGKPAAVISASPGAMGGFGANHHLRQSLAFLNMPTLAQPEAYLAHAFELFGRDGRPAGPRTAAFLREFGAAFAQLIERYASVQARAA